MSLQKTAQEIELIRESAQIVSKTLGMLASEICPGVTTLQLDALAETFIRDHGAIPCTFDHHNKKYVFLPRNQFMDETIGMLKKEREDHYLLEQMIKYLSPLKLLVLVDTSTKALSRAS